MAFEDIRRVEVGPVEELPPGARKIVVPFRGRAGIGVFNVNGSYHALRNLCPHKSGPLCTGRVSGSWWWPMPRRRSRTPISISSRDGEIIRCPWHMWEFEIATGRCLVDAKARVKTYPVVGRGRARWWSTPIPRICRPSRLPILICQPSPAQLNWLATGRMGVMASYRAYCVHGYNSRTDGRGDLAPRDQALCPQMAFRSGVAPAAGRAPEPGNRAQADPRLRAGGVRQVDAARGMAGGRPRSANGPLAWVSLDRADNDPALFWAYVIAALRKIHPGSAGTR